jgi:hypothetical protein
MASRGAATVNLLNVARSESKWRQVIDCALSVLLVVCGLVSIPALEQTSVERDALVPIH